MLQLGDKVSIIGIRLSDSEKEDGSDFFNIILPDDRRIAVMQENYFDGCTGKVVRIWPSSILMDHSIIEVEIPVRMILLCREEEINVVPHSDTEHVLSDGFPP